MIGFQFHLYRPGVFCFFFCFVLYRCFLRASFASGPLLILRLFFSTSVVFSLFDVFRYK